MFLALQEFSNWQPATDYQVNRWEEGRAIAASILRDLRGQPREKFHYFDKGQMATIGRSRAIAQTGRFKLTGFLAWLAWLVVHIYYLTGFRNRLLVVLQWAWSKAERSPS